MGEGDLKPSYRKNIYFAEEEISMHNAFNEEIHKDERFESLGKGDKKFSAVIKLFMKNYLKKRGREYDRQIQ